MKQNEQSNERLMTNRRIVLTGAGRGLGRAMLEGFVTAGNIVYACSQSQQSVDELRRKFSKGPHRFERVNVTSDEQVGEWAKSILADGGPPDMLINNAAVI